MNLFDIEKTIWSHPGYPYLRHIQNICNCFDDETHKEVSLYHDIGKLSDEFQKFINGINKTKTTHALESGLTYLLEHDCNLTPDIFINFLAIIRHHNDLPNINEFIEDYLSCNSYYNNIQPKLEVILHNAHIDKQVDLDDLPDFFDCETFVENFELNTLKNYFKIKETFSKLIFADKYEAIFKESFNESYFNKSEVYIAKLLKQIKAKTNQLTSIRNCAREDIISTYHENKDKRIYVIEAPTGIGKTLSALHLALEITKTKNKKRIINALPLTSVIDQTYREYSQIIDDGDLLKFHHLTSAKVYIINDEEEDLSYKQKNDYIASSWCFDRIIITTFNQVLNAIYSNKNKDLTKFWTLRDSVVIFDEIQNIPRLLLQDIAKTFNFLSTELNIDFILMSATIPAIKNFLNDNITSDLLDTGYFSKGFNNRYKLILDQNINSVDLLVKKIIRANEEWMSIMCIVNTKKLSLEIFESLEKWYSSEELFLLNTNFIPVHRDQIINIIKSRLAQNKKTILIATQVVEAGVDLDFDYGFREFAPLSSIIQTAGRINREGNKTDSELVVTSLIGNSPYNSNDLLYKEVLELLPAEIRENQILHYLKEYFELAINNTRPDLLLIQEMQNLNFNSVFKIFEDTFMPGIPNLVSIFIETEEGQYDQFVSIIVNIHGQLKSDISLEQKMSLKSEMKDVYRKIAANVIEISINEAREYPEFHPNSNMRYCPHNLVINGNIYSRQKGWLNKTEALFF